MHCAAAGPGDTYVYSSRTGLIWNGMVLLVHVVRKQQVVECTLHAGTPRQQEVCNHKTNKQTNFQAVAIVGGLLGPNDQTHLRMDSKTSNGFQTTNQEGVSCSHVSC